MTKSPGPKNTSLKRFKIEKESFVKAPLKEKCYTDTAFINCDFTESIFYNTHFDDCLFHGCNLSLVKWDGSRIQNTHFLESKLTGADFFKCDPFLFSPYFTKCQLIMANFSDLLMKKAKFLDCNLLECHFYNTKLVLSDFSGSNLAGTQFHNCDLTEADFTKAFRYFINPSANCVKRAKFSLPEAISLLKGFDLEII